MSFLRKGNSTATARDTTLNARGDAGPAGPPGAEGQGHSRGDTRESPDDKPGREQASSVRWREESRVPVPGPWCAPSSPRPSSAASLRPACSARPAKRPRAPEARDGSARHGNEALWPPGLRRGRPTRATLLAWTPRPDTPRHLRRALCHPRPTRTRESRAEQPRSPPGTSVSLSPEKCKL